MYVWQLWEGMWVYLAFHAHEDELAHPLARHQRKRVLKQVRHNSDKL